MKKPTTDDYLQHISYIYLYHSVSGSKGLYILYNSFLSTMRVIVAAEDREELSQDILRKQYVDACQGLIDKRSDYTLQLNYVGTFQEAEELLDKDITDFRSQFNRNAVTLVQCSRAASMQSIIKVFKDFPCVSIPSYVSDDQYQDDAWQEIAAKIGIRRYVESLNWFIEKIKLSTYSHVPVGNIEPDWLLQITDIFLSRELCKMNQIHLVSYNEIQDLGDNEVNQPVRSSPGAYRTVTVEIKIHNLATSALQLLKNSKNSFSGSRLSSHDEELTNTALLAMIDALPACSKPSGKEFADQLLQHLYRWLCSPQSKHYVPDRLRVVHNAMAIIHAALLEVLETRGFTIIFANYSKVIIATGKSDVSAARTCFENIRVEDRLDKLFGYQRVALEASQFWDSFLFLDQHNYSGLQVESNLTANHVRQWCIAENLSTQTQDHLLKFVDFFVYFSWNMLQDIARENEGPANEYLQMKFTEHLSIEIRDRFTSKLTNVAHEVKKEKKKFSFVQSFEMVNCVCAILELDLGLQNAVHKMKFSVFKALCPWKYQSGDDPELKKYPISFTLPNVFCSCGIFNFLCLGVSKLI